MRFADMSPPYGAGCDGAKLSAAYSGAWVTSQFRTALFICLLLVSDHAAAAQSDIIIDPTTPSDTWFAAASAQLLPPKPSRGFADLPAGQIGWLEFSFEAPTAGWWRLDIGGGDGDLDWHDLELDPSPSPEGAKAVVGTLRPNDWIWLDAGAHRLRISNYFWHGLKAIDRIRLIAPHDQQPGAFRVLASADTAVAAIGACRPMRIVSGGTGKTARISALFRRGNVFVGKRDLDVPATAVPVTLSIDPPCDAAGDVSAVVAMPGGRTDARLESSYRYSVFDPRPAEPSFNRGNLVIDIDPVAQAPDYTSGGVTTVVGTGANAYRESGDAGGTRFARRSAQSGEPSWFAYTVRGLKPGQPVLLELTYPDDAQRVMVAAIRDLSARSYPTSIGMETGAQWPITHAPQTRSAVFWPSSTEARVLVVNVHDGMRAAVSRIRLYGMTLAEKPASPPAPGKRDVVIWNEEGDNFRALVGFGGMPDAVFEPIDRYLRLARAAGATIFSPTTVIYSFQLFPSRFNLAFNRQRQDLTAAFLIGAQRYGLRVIPELHPRADELLWPARDEAEIKRRLMLSGTGETNLYQAPDRIRRPPYYNPLNPDVRAWYRDMIVEFATRYRDFPAFGGVQLRLSQWVNSSLNNFVSLDWGYDAPTVAQFYRDTGTTPPVGLDLIHDSVEAARARRAVLTGSSRAAWVAWRCGQIRDILADITTAVRAVRPDLTVSVSVFAMSYGRQPGYEELRELGVDAALLSRVPGLRLVDGRFSYGNREASPSWQGYLRTAALAPNALAALAPDGRRPETIMPMQYIELPGPRVWPNAKLGLPASAGEPWISASSEPSGRLRLARYAELVGLFDVFQLGDGGNGYIFGDDNTAAFMREFAALPRVPFERVATGADTLVLRQNGDMFYVVNVAPNPAKAVIRAEGAGAVRRLSDGTAVGGGDGTLTLDLQAYELRAFRAERVPTRLTAQSVGSAP